MNTTPQQHILDICDMVLRAGANAGSLIEQTGAEPQSDGYRSITAGAVHPAFETITTTQEEPESDIPEFVTLTVKDGQQLTIGDLETVLGEYRQVPRRLHTAPQVAYFYEPEGSIACTIFASYEPSVEPEAQTPVTEIMIRKE